MSQPTVRSATQSDLVRIAAIYAHYVRTSTATFDVQEPPLSAWQAKLDSTAVGDHFLVAHRALAHPPAAGRPGAQHPVPGHNDTVLGFAYSAAFRPRPAYRGTREVSVYLAPEATGSGLGTRLYDELLSLLRQDGVHLVVAVVTQPNPASSAMHRRLGFAEAGTLDEVGNKFGTYLSTTYFQLRLT